MAPRNMLGLLASAALVALAGCSSGRGGGVEASNTSRADGVGLFGGDADEVPGIGVNAFLWRASLDTLSFMPLDNADPWGGVINTEWYANPEKPDERFKATVYILDTRLRADAVTVSVFKETSGENGWETAAIDPATTIAIENAILTRARQLRLAAIES
ncbi:MAG: DUF3576 domain-containing protein [Pseudomonadota bacterium]